VPTSEIEALPPIDHVPITSAVTAPEPNSTVQPGTALLLSGYAYSGAGHAVIRVDVSIDGGSSWAQADIQRPCETQHVRSGRAWAWIQWKYSTTVPENASGTLKIVCKAIDDQYNQQPHESSSIWNVRGILNTAWGRVDVQVANDGLEISEAAMSGDGTIHNVGVKIGGTFQCAQCRQKFESERAQELHCKFIHDPHRPLED